MGIPFASMAVKARPGFEPVKQCVRGYARIAEPGVLLVDDPAAGALLGTADTSECSRPPESSEGAYRASQASVSRQWSRSMWPAPGTSSKVASGRRSAK